MKEIKKLKRLGSINYDFEEEEDERPKRNQQEKIDVQQLTG